jgi:hypothetical protein
MGWLY